MCKPSTSSDGTPVVQAPETAFLLPFFPQEPAFSWLQLRRRKEKPQNPKRQEGKRPSGQVRVPIKDSPGSRPDSKCEAAWPGLAGECGLLRMLRVTEGGADPIRTSSLQLFDPEITALLGSPAPPNAAPRPCSFTLSKQDYPCDKRCCKTEVS